MARIRTIKPEFWTDEKIVQLPFEARLFFVGLWNFADDDGCFGDEPERLRLQVFPSDPTVNIALLLDELWALELIEYIIPDDVEEGFWRVKGFNEHQKISHPSKTKRPIKGAKKMVVPAKVRREVAKKYGCEPGSTHPVECFYCGIPGKIWWPLASSGAPSYWVAFDLEMDHFEPESVGGETLEHNIVLACRSCNRRKNSRNALEFFIDSLESSGGLAKIPGGLSREGKGIEGKDYRRESVVLGSQIEKTENNGQLKNKNPHTQINDSNVFQYFCDTWNQQCTNAIGGVSPRDFSSIDFHHARMAWEWITERVSRPNDDRTPQQYLTEFLGQYVNRQQKIYSKPIGEVTLGYFLQDKVFKSIVQQTLAPSP